VHVKLSCKRRQKLNDSVNKYRCNDEIRYSEFKNQVYEIRASLDRKHFALLADGSKKDSLSAQRHQFGDIILQRFKNFVHHKNSKHKYTFT